MDLKQFFKDWDRLGRNKVSPKQFRQVLAMVNFPISDIEFEVIVKMYSSDDDDNVKYVEFIKDTIPPQNYSIISGNLNDQGHNVSFNSRNFEKNNCSDEHEEATVLMNKLKKTIKINQLRIGEYFKDYDPLKKGILPINKFKGVLTQMK